MSGWTDCIISPERGNTQGNAAGWPRNQTAHCFSLLFVFGEKNPYFFFRRFRPFLERGLRFLLLILIKVNFLKLKFTNAINARTSRAKVHPAATSFYKNLHQNIKRTGGIYMDSTHFPQRMEKTEKEDTLKTFSNLPKAVRTAFAAGEAFGQMMAQAHETAEKKE